MNAPLRPLNATEPHPLRARSLLFKLAFSLIVGSAGSLPAATIIWTAGTNGNWNVPANWTDSAIPSSHVVPTSTDTARINTTTLQTVTVDSNVGSVSQLQLGNAIANTGGSLLITNGGTLTAATIATTDQLSGTSIITQNGGVLNSTSVNWGRVNSSSANVTYFMQGGTLSVSGIVAIGGNSSGNGSGSILQSGGLLSAVSLIVNKGIGAGNNTTYQMSGGALSISGSLVNGVASSSSNTTLRIIGSTGTMTVQGNYSQNSAATYNVQLDNGGVTKLNLTSASGTASLAGTLSAGFKGAAALTSGTSFRVVEAEVLTGDFSTKPSSSLWTTGTQANVSGTRDAYVLSLASSAKVGDMSLSGSLTFSATSSGFASISSLPINSPIQIFLSASAGSSTTSALISYFNANGLTASATSFGGYDIELDFTPTTSTSYFAWDLSSFNSTASLSGLAAVVPEPSIVFLTGLGLAGLACYRRQRR